MLRQITEQIRITMNILNDDVLYNVMNFFNLREILMISMIDKRFNLLTKCLILKKIKSQIKKQNGDFVENILKLNCYLSGSYLMHTLMANYLNSGDIDIYVSKKNSIKVIYFLMNLKTFKFNKKKTEEDVIVFNNRTVNNHNTYTNTINNVFGVLKFKICKKYKIITDINAPREGLMCLSIRNHNSNSNEYLLYEKYKEQNIDLVIVNDNISIKNFIKNEFDMSCVKNWYSINELYINKLNDTFGPVKKTYISSSKVNIASKIGRLDKYRKHGFEIIKESTYTDELGEFLGTLLIN